jgi:hypothetical protein
MQKLEEGPKAESFNLGEDAQARGAEFVEMKGRENLEGIPGGKEISFLTEKVEIFHLVDGSSL